MYYITIPDFELNVHIAVRPILKEIPFAVSDGTRIIACNVFAKQSGVKVGMANSEARKIVTLLTIEKLKPAVYENFSKEFYRILSLYTNVIEPVRYHSAFIELPLATNNSHKSEIIGSLILKIEKELEMSIAVGEGSTKTIAEIAATIISPKGILTIPKEINLSFLKTIPVSFFPGIGRRSATILWGLGIKSVADLAQQSNEVVFRLFGKTGLFLKERANGLDARCVEPPVIKKSITKSLRLNHPSVRWHYLVSMLHFCLSKVERELLASCQWSSSVKISITRMNGEKESETFQVSKSKRSALASQAESALHTLLQNKKSPICTLRIQANQLLPENNSAYFFNSAQKRVPAFQIGQLAFSALLSPFRKATAGS